MEIKNQHRLRFYGVDFPNVEFTSFKPVSGKTPEIHINIEPKIFLPKDKKEYFNIVMKVELNADEYFNLQLLAIGNFEISGEKITKKIRKDFINANAPAIMFPYIRSFITAFTSNLGNVTGSIVIPTKFFKGEMVEIDYAEKPEIT